MKTKSFLLVAIMSFLFVPLAMAASAEDLYLKGLELRSTKDGSGRPNKSAALHYFKAACDKKHAEACLQIHYITYTGRFTEESSEPYLNKSCKLGNEDACHIIKESKKAKEAKEKRSEQESQIAEEVAKEVKQELGIDITTEKELELAIKWVQAKENCKRLKIWMINCDAAKELKKALLGKQDKPRGLEW